jgi:23S rRNA (uracil1939-C5)-methyltransferase
LGAGHVADLFSGLGTFALPLSAHARVMAADAAGAAIQALQQAAHRHQRPVTARHRDLFRAPLEAKELDQFDAVVVDPPRAGAKAQAEMIARSAVQRVAMVSCNPNSFARDARILIDGGFKLRRIWPVGQFRWSIHVELAASFER